MLNLSVVTPPTETVTFAEMQAHLRVGTEEQTLIESLTTAAREWCELIARRSFVTQTFQVTTECWPGLDGYRLPFVPLVSVDFIKYYTTDNVLRTLSAAVYQVETSCNPGQVILAFNQAWPGDALRPGYPIVIQYQAGYGAASNVPQRYKHAIKLLTAHWFENREAVLTSGGGTGSVTLDLALQSLLLVDRGGYVDFYKN
mgnify:CR=1 FL=1